jgi:STE24 endopeptidase
MSFELPESWRAHDERVGSYVGWHRFFSSLRLLVGVLVLWRLIGSHQLVVFEASLNARGASGFSLFLWFFGTLAVLWELVTFPLSAAHYSVDRVFGVSRQSYWGWLSDYFKGLAVGASLGLIALLFVWYAVSHWGEWWWVALCAFFIFFSVVLAQLAPVLLVPLFFKMSPLPDGPLRLRLLEMSSRLGVTVREIFLLGLGDKTEKGNAAFMGLGKTKRIAIGDTIYQKYPEDQVLAVFAHELGHLVHKDIWKGLCLSSVFMFASFGSAHFLATYYFLPKWFTWIEAPFGMFLYFLLVALVSLPLGIVERIYSRWRENKADAFAAGTMKMAAPLADALEALTFQNRSLFKPHALREFLFYSHPAPWRRISGLRQ